jgi:hypothetical protein
VVVVEARVDQRLNDDGRSGRTQIADARCRKRREDEAEFALDVEQEPIQA